MMIMTDSIARFCVVVTLGASGPAWSQATPEQVCEEMGKMAEAIMNVRQQEAPMSDVLKKVVPPDDGSGASDFVRSVIIAAYDQGAMVTEENKKAQAARFRNNVEVECFKGIAKG